MTSFQLTSSLLVAIWLILVVVRFRRLSIVLIAGLFVIGLYPLRPWFFTKSRSSSLDLTSPNNGSGHSPWLFFGWD